MNDGMTTRLPAPLTHASCDLRDFPYMPLMVAQFRDSDLAADETPEVCWAAMLIQAASWHQVPAGSVPDDDNWIAKTANYRMRGKTDRAWKRVRQGALHGWMKCSDGRLYHPDVAQKANDAWESKLKQRYRSECARLAKLDPPAPRPEYDEWMQNGCPVGKDGDKLLNPQGFQGIAPKDAPETGINHPKDAQKTFPKPPLDVQVEVEVEVKGEGNIPTTETSSVVECAQARATPPPDPPVDNPEKPEGLAEQPTAEPEKTNPVSEVDPAKPDKPPKAVRKKSAIADLVLGVDDIVAEGVQRENVECWFIARRDKGAKRLSVKAWTRFKNQATLASVSLDEAVQLCAEKNWQGFEADWYARLNGNRTPALARASPAASAQPETADVWIRPESEKAFDAAYEKLFGVTIDAAV